MEACFTVVPPPQPMSIHGTCPEEDRVHIPSLVRIYHETPLRVRRQFMPLSNGRRIGSLNGP